MAILCGLLLLINLIANIVYLIRNISFSYLHHEFYATQYTQKITKVPSGMKNMSLEMMDECNFLHVFQYSFTLLKMDNSCSSSFCITLQANVKLLFYYNIP